MSIAVLSGAFTSSGQSSEVRVQGGFNVSLSGFGTATIGVQRSFDNGSTWVTVEEFSSDVERRGNETEDKVLYRFNCSSYTSGTIAYRLSR